MNIPLEIRLRILEYAGQAWMLNIGNEDLIKRIGCYDIGFDYEVYQSIIAKKKMFIEQTNNSDLKALYDNIMDHTHNSILLDSQICMRPIDKTLSYVSELLLPLFRRINPEVCINPTSDIRTIDYVRFSHTKDIYEQLLLIHQRYYRERYYSWNYAIINRSHINYRIFDIACIQHIPCTLADMLRYTLWKQRMLRTIIAWKEYHLYRALTAYNISWSTFSNGKTYSIYFSNPEPLVDDIMSIYPNAIQHMSNGVCNYIGVSFSDEPVLQTIDQFFHPHIPMRDISR